MSARPGQNIQAHASSVPEFKKTKEYKERVAGMYDRRSDTYDQGTWHDEIGKKLIHGCGMQKGHSVLDMCTGTAIGALIAAEEVGSDGRVVGVDISEKMLEKAQEKVKDIGNVEVMHGDVETIDFPAESFDWITCCAAFLFLTDYKATLMRWRKFIKPRGGIALHTFNENSWVTGASLIKAAAKHGVEITIQQPTGTADRISKLLEEAGFSDVRVEEYKAGKWRPLEDVLEDWNDFENENFPFAPPLFEVSEEVRQAIRMDYEQLLRDLDTEKGVWEDKTAYMTYGLN